MSETKICEQCQLEKDIEQFYKRPQKNNPSCRIKICAQCDVENLQESRRKRDARIQEWRKEKEREAREQEEQRRLAVARKLTQEEREAILTEMGYPLTLDTPTKVCRDCKHTYPLWDFSQSYLWLKRRLEESSFLELTRTIEDGLITYSYNSLGPYGVGSFSGPREQEVDPSYFLTRCPACHENYKKRNKRFYPTCYVCHQQSSHREFTTTWREGSPDALPHPTYNGYHLGGSTIDGIFLFCKDCEEAFFHLPLHHQETAILRATEDAYRSPAYIYYLIDPRDQSVFNIGRTSDPKQRFKDHFTETYAYEDKPDNAPVFYKWKKKGNVIHELKELGLKPIMKTVETLSFGALSAERELRHIVYGLSQHWPLRNLEASQREWQECAASLTFGEDGVHAAFTCDLAVLLAPREFTNTDREAVRFIHDIVEPIYRKRQLPPPEPNQAQAEELQAVQRTIQPTALPGF